MTKRNSLGRDIAELARRAGGQKVFYAILMGKAIGLALVVLGILGARDLFDHAAHAADGGTVHSECVNPLNTMWTPGENLIFSLISCPAFAENAAAS